MSSGTLEPVTLAKEEMEALRTLLTAARPLCWYCAHCPPPEKRRRDDRCDYFPGVERRGKKRIPLPRPLWREAVRSGECRFFRALPERLGARLPTPPSAAKEQLTLVFSGKDIDA